MVKWFKRWKLNRQADQVIAEIMDGNSGEVDARYALIRLLAIAELLDRYGDSELKNSVQNVIEIFRREETERGLIPSSYATMWPSAKPVVH